MQNIKYSMQIMRHSECLTAVFINWTGREKSNTANLHILTSDQFLYANFSPAISLFH